MAGNAEQAGSSLKRRNPGLQARASDVTTFDGNHEMNNSTAVSNVIPFAFEAKSVRVQEINGAPWFCVTDVCSILGYSNSRDAMAKHCREAGVAKRDISSAGQKRALTFISEGNLYRLIIKSRKEEAQRFESWVCDEVLPAIRKSGAYTDTGSSMPSMLNELIGTSELNVLKGLIRQKGASLPIEHQRSAGARMYSAVHTRFNVSRTELIPHKDFAEACNFIAAYNVLEGEFIQAVRKEEGIRLDKHETHCLYLLMSRFVTMHKHKHQMLAAARALGSDSLMSMFDQLHDGHISFSTLDKRRDELYAAYTATGCVGGYAWSKSA